MDNHVFTITEREALRTGASAINTLLGWLTPDTSFNGLSFHELKDIADSLERMANRRAAPAPPAAKPPYEPLTERDRVWMYLQEYRIFDRIETLEQIAGYGSAAAPAGEPGRGERSGEGG